MRRDHLDADRRRFGIQMIGIVGGIADEACWWFLNQEFPERDSDQRDFIGRSTCRGYGDRRTSAVWNGLECTAKMRQEVKG